MKKYFVIYTNKANKTIIYGSYNDLDNAMKALENIRNSKAVVSCGILTPYMWEEDCHAI